MTFGTLLCLVTSRQSKLSIFNSLSWFRDQNYKIIDNIQTKLAMNIHWSQIYLLRTVSETHYINDNIFNHPKKALYYAITETEVDSLH